MGRAGMDSIATYQETMNHHIAVLVRVGRLLALLICYFLLNNPVIRNMLIGYFLYLQHQ